jgi:hypothetical protein
MNEKKIQWQHGKTFQGFVDLGTVNDYMIRVNTYCPLFSKEQWKTNDPRNTYHVAVATMKNGTADKVLECTTRKNKCHSVEEGKAWGIKTLQTHLAILN